MGDCRRMGACIVSKNITGNDLENGRQDGNSIPDIVWILPFMMIGAMFGSLAGVGFGYELGQPTPFGLALIGIIVGMLIVGATGLLIKRSL